MIILIVALSIMATIASLAGNILIACSKRSGWITWIVGNILWIEVNFLDTMNVPMVCMYIIYMIINIVGFVKWRKR